MKIENYYPFGEAWQKEMMRLPKKVIVDMVADAQAGVKPLSMPPLPDGLDDENINHYHFRRGWIECWKAIESKLKGQVEADHSDTDGQI